MRIVSCVVLAPNGNATAVEEARCINTNFLADNWGLNAAEKTPNCSHLFLLRRIPLQLNNRHPYSKCAV